MNTKLLKISSLIMAPLFLLIIYLIFFYAPLEKQLGFSQKIFYFHVPIAWNGLLAFTVVFFGSIAYLRTKNITYDIIARASAELGIIFTVLTLLTGSIWARTAWNTWWDWTDIRLITYFLLLMLYVGYVMLGNAVEEESKRARFNAVFGIVAFVNVPLVFFSVRWWNSATQHPVLFKSGMVLDGAMKLAFFSSLAVFTVFFVVLLINRIKLGKIQESLLEIKEGV